MTVRGRVFSLLISFVFVVSFLVVPVSALNIDIPYPTGSVYYLEFSSVFGSGPSTATKVRSNQYYSVWSGFSGDTSYVNLFCANALPSDFLISASYDLSTASSLSVLADSVEPVSKGVYIVRGCRSGNFTFNFSTHLTYTTLTFSVCIVPLDPTVDDIFDELKLINSELVSLYSDINKNHSELTQQLDNHQAELIDTLLHIDNAVRGFYDEFAQPLSDVPLSPSYFSRIVFTSPRNEIFASDGRFECTISSDFVNLSFFRSSSNIGPYLIPGNSYRFSLSYMGTLQDTFMSGVGYSVSSVSYYVQDNRVYIDAVIVPSRVIDLYYFYIRLNGHIDPGEVSFSFSFDNSATFDSNLKQSVNQGQAAATDQLQSEIDKSEAFESQIFEDVNRYTKQLDFGLSDWGEAASGISYISSVFMIIWDNSPKQPIILSLMLGLCMLLLGRGARLAGEVRKANDRAERSQRRTKGG